MEILSTLHQSPESCEAWGTPDEGKCTHRPTIHMCVSVHTCMCAREHTGLPSSFPRLACSQFPVSFSGRHWRGPHSCRMPSGDKCGGIKHTSMYVKISLLHVLKAVILAEESFPVSGTTGTLSLSVSELGPGLDRGTCSPMAPWDRGPMPASRSGGLLSAGPCLT